MKPISYFGDNGAGQITDAQIDDVLNTVNEVDSERAADTRWQRRNAQTPQKASPRKTLGTPVTIVDDGKPHDRPEQSAARLDENGNLRYDNGKLMAEDRPDAPAKTAKSTQMMEAMNAGYSPNQGTAKSWDDAIARQRSGAVKEVSDLQQKRYEFFQREKKQREKMVAERNFTAAAAAQIAGRELMEGGGETRTDTRTGKRYRMVTIDGSMMDRASEQSAAMGRKSSLGAVAVRAEVNKDGNIVGKPTYMIGLKTNNGDGQKDSLTYRPLDEATVINQYAESLAKMRDIPLGNARAAAVDAFGGRNPMQWTLGDVAQVPASVQAARERANGAMKVEGMKQKGRADLAKLNSETQAALKAIEQGYKQSRDLEKARLTLKTLKGGPLNKQLLSDDEIETYLGDMQKRLDAAKDTPKAEPPPASQAATSSGDNSGSGEKQAQRPQEGARQQFRQGWATFKNGKWVLDAKK